ncbi:MAG: BPL-N domain-containing protein [Planctomycetaceae bacterium]
MKLSILSILLTLLIHEPTVTVSDSGQPGHAVLIVAVNRKDSAAASAINQIRSWKPSQGKLICAEIPETPNNSDPAAASAKLTQLLISVKPDWLVEIHETAGSSDTSAVLQTGSITADNQASLQISASHLCTVANTEIEITERHFQVSETPVKSSLIATLPKADNPEKTMATLLIRTVRKDQSLAVRNRQHRRITAELLQQLAVVKSASVADLLVTAENYGQFNIALLDDAGVGGRGIPALLEIWAAEPGVTVERVCGADIRSGCLTQFDLLCCSGGSGSRQARSLGNAGREAVRNFVSRGGDYVGICAGSYLACSGFSWGLGILDAKTKSSKWMRGRAELPLTLTDAGARIFAEGPRTAAIIYNNGPIIQPHEQSAIPDYQVLATFTAEVAKNQTPAGIMVDSPAIVAGKFGAGEVLCISPHPEQSGDIGRTWIGTALKKLRLNEITPADAAP